MIPYRARPSAGFVLLAAVVTIAAAFLGYGLATPPLDEVWRLQHELATGERGPLTGRERKLLEETLARHPALAEAWLDGARAGVISEHRAGLVEGGYVYVVRKGPGPLTLQVALAPGEGGPVDARVRAGTWRNDATLEQGAPWSWRLPDEGPFPQLVEVLVGEHKKKKKKKRGRAGRPPAAAVIVRLGEAT